MSGPPNPPFPAYRGTFTAAAYTSSAAPRYGPPLAPNAGGLVLTSTSGGYPSALPGYAHGFPLSPNAASFHGAPPGFNGALPGLPTAAAFHDAPLGNAHSAGFNGAPGHAYASRGLNPGASSFERRDSGGLNPDARPFERHDTVVDRLESRQDAGGGLNSLARSLERYESGAHHPGLNFLERHDTGINGPESRQDAGGALNSGARSLERYHSGAQQRGLNFHAGQLSEATVRKIWRHNCSEAFQEIRQLIANREGLLYIGIDIEYLADASTDITFRPFTADEWYRSLQDYVNNGTVLQIGLAFAIEKENSPILAYELNLLVDLDQGSFHKDAVDFLKKHNHDFTKHREVGILPEWILAGLLQHLPFGSDSVVWVAYHGDRDFPFFLRLLEGGGVGVRLPSSFCSFSHQFKQNFPLYYDVRVLAQMVKEGYRGKLTTLAGVEYLNLKRMGGEHHAGSDALLTLRCFCEIVQRYKVEGIIARKGLLSGVEELQLPISCYRHVTATDVKVVNVYHANFDQESAYISQTIGSNFDTIGLLIAGPQDFNPIKMDYATLKCAVGEVDSFELLLAFMNSEGNLAFGRAWRFFLKVEAREETRVNPQRLSALLATSRTTHNKNAVWVTYGGEYGLACLMRSFVAPGHLPPSSVRYKIAQSSLFPHVFDVKAMVQGCEGLEFIGDIRETALQLGVDVDACDVITILRCFYSLRSRVNKDTDEHA